jgi:hypothetical protein
MTMIKMIGMIMRKTKMTKVESQVEYYERVYRKKISWKLRLKLIWIRIQHLMGGHGGR